MTDYNGTTFEAADLYRAMFAYGTFTSCAFNGKADRCNFSKATFTTCTFGDGFKFENCNLASVTGITPELVDGGIYSTPEEYVAEIQEKISLGLLPRNYTEE